MPNPKERKGKSNCSKKITEHGIRRTITDMDISDADSDSPPPSENTVQRILEDVRGHKGRKRISRRYPS